MYCKQCGREISADSEFCAYCGAATDAAASGEAAASQSTSPPPGFQPAAPPPAMEAPLTSPPGTYPQPTAYPPPPKKSALPWILGLLGIAALAAVVLVLVFVVFKGGTNTAGPEKVVENFYESMEKKDVDMLLGTMEPVFLNELEDTLGKDYKDLVEEYTFAAIPDDFKVIIRKMDTKITGDKAEVTVLEGTISYTDEYGDTVTEEASESDVPPLELVKIDGKWYLSADTLKKMGFDLSDLQGFNSNDVSPDGDYNLNNDLSGYDDLQGDVVLPVDSEDEVLNLIIQDPDIWDWYLSVNEPLYEITDEGDTYMVHLFEVVEDGGPGHTATFGWFAVDKETGEVYEVVE